MSNHSPARSAVARANNDGPLDLIRDLVEAVADYSTPACTAVQAVEDGRSRLLATTSHDALQPLESARLLIEVLSARLPEGSHERDLATQAARAVNAAAGQLRGLLSMSRRWTGRLDPDRRHFPLQPMLDELIASARPIAERKGLELRCVQTSARVFTDRDMLHSIIQNLLGNGLKYTARGGVLLGVRRCADGVRLDVIDTGPGIATNRIDDAFVEYGQLGEVGTGVGLGLSIVNRLCQLLGHNLTVASVPGRGSRFSVMLRA